MKLNLLTFLLTTLTTSITANAAQQFNCEFLPASKVFSKIIDGQPVSNSLVSNCNDDPEAFSWGIYIVSVRPNGNIVKSLLKSSESDFCYYEMDLLNPYGGNAQEFIDKYKTSGICRFIDGH